MVRLTPARLLCAALLLCVCFIVTFISRAFSRPRGFDIFPERPRLTRSRVSAGDVPYGEECSPFKAGAMNDVVIVIKTGAGEVMSKLPAYLNRLGRCKQDLLFFSDRKADYDGWEIIDALAEIRPEYVYNNPHFKIYDRIQRATTVEDKSRDAWVLDKYKYLPMMELTWQRRPNANWFVFIELDTYVNWDNMLRFLSHFNPKTPYYFGSPAMPHKKTAFAHGGSGFVLSHAALNKLMARGRMFAENHHSPGTHLFGKDLKKECCGDEVLANVLKESGVGVKGYWPMFNGEKPTTARFGRHQWCEAILTLHHLQTDDFALLEQFETSRTRPSLPLTFEELFTSIESSLRERIEDWTNISEDVTHRNGHAAGKSFEACALACRRDRRCLQFQHFGKTCQLSHDIRLGHHQPPDGDTKWISGWRMDRIQAFKAGRSPCREARMVHPSPR